MPTALTAVVLLTISNAFMTFAWYGHLKYPRSAMWVAILASWGIALLEYCFQVPANRIGNAGGLSASQLKIMQEVITLVVFCVFASTWLGEKITWNYYVGFGCVLLGVFFVYYKW
ncbi:MAG: DMT family protein [Phycisphaerales bacterium]|nr:DMT family protein [Phycisphaerales bacterium]